MQCDRCAASVAGSQPGRAARPDTVVLFAVFNAAQFVLCQFFQAPSPVPCVQWPFALEGATLCVITILLYRAAVVRNAALLGVLSFILVCIHHATHCLLEHTHPPVVAQGGRFGAKTPRH